MTLLRTVGFLSVLRGLAIVYQALRTKHFFGCDSGVVGGPPTRDVRAEARGGQPCEMTDARQI